MSQDHELPQQPSLHVLTTLLASIPAFAGLDDASLGLLAAELDIQHLAGGDILMRQGERGDALFFVATGKLGVSVTDDDGRPVVIDHAAHGAVLGEMALLAGDRRSATVTATAPATVARLSREGFDRLARGQPGLRQQVIAAITPRLERVQLASVLESWFGIDGDDETAIEQLRSRTEWLSLPSGGVLFRPGDPADGLYLVVSGRLQVTPADTESGDPTRRNSGTSTAGHHGSAPSAFVGYQVYRGDSVGELAVLEGGLRQATVTALRDSHLLWVPTDLVGAHPKALRRIARSALRRAGAVRTRLRRGNGVHTIVVAPAHDGAPATEVATLLERELRSHGSPLILGEHDVTDAFGGEIPAPGSGLDASLTHWLNELERANDFLLLLAGPEAEPHPGSGSTSNWSARSRRQADVVLLVADASRPPDSFGGESQPAAQLVLVHPAGTEQPTGTAAWLDRTGASAVHHVRSGDAFGAARLARRLIGRAVGLVFSGGGARGYAHIGTLKAIEELGIEVDMIAGTSMGALIGATYALQGSSASVERAAVTFGDKKRLLDRTLPLVALTRSQGVTDTVRSIFGDVHIEDLWFPFCCVSANLFQAVPVEHRKGPLWQAVRASTAIPGIFTPLVSDGGLLVDGAVMNAFPVDLVREMVDTGTVIASSTMTTSAPREPFTFGPSVSGWEALAQYLRPRNRRTRYPSMIKTLMEATSVGSKHLSVTTRALADVLVELPVGEFGKLEFHRHQELIELGYRFALGELRAWMDRTES